MKSGKLYVIGVGPGDPELLTIKGLRILNMTSCICVPKGREKGSSLALSIAKQAVDLENKEILEAYFPMRKTRQQGAGVRGQGLENSELNTKWDESVKNILNRLNKGIDVAFITLGDPTIYSTFFYLYDRLLEAIPGVNIEIIPGVSSINASAARAGISLGLADEKIAVLPATYVDDLRDVIEKFDTVVLMKAHRVFEKILATLDEMGLTSNAVYISQAGMEEEKIVRDIKNLKGEELNYFSMVIIRR